MKPLCSKAFTGYLYIGIRCAYNLCMNTNTNTTDYTIYRNVMITNLRNASTNGDKIQMRLIATTYIADRWSDGGEAVRGTSSIKRAHAMIDWLLANGAPVVDGRIVTTLGDFDTCEFGCRVRGIQGYSQYMKAGK